MFTIYGGKTEFNQWDLDQLITCDCLKEGDDVVFSGYGKTYETTAFVQEGKVWADVPNFMLQKAGSFVVDLGWGLNRHMDCRTVFSVAAKAKPEDYVCPYNIKPRNTAANGGGSSAPSDWNAPEGTAGHVLNRTHYEEVTEVMGDTLTWDGNTEGLESPMFGYYKVSDIVLTLDDLVNGCTVAAVESGQSATISISYEMLAMAHEMFGAVTIMGESSIYALSIPTDGFEREGAVFSKGTYFMAMDAATYTGSLTIPGYTGFKTTATTVKTIDPKYLPEALQFGEELQSVTVVDNQTLEFNESPDGNIWRFEGMVSAPPRSVIAATSSIDVIFDNTVYQNVDYYFFGGSDHDTIQTADSYFATYPFSIDITAYDYATRLTIQTLNSSETHTISVIVRYVDIHHIDSKYIKDMYISDLTEVLRGGVENIQWDDGNDGYVSFAHYSDSIKEYIESRIGSDEGYYEEYYSVVELTINNKTRVLTTRDGASPGMWYEDGCGYLDIWPFFCVEVEENAIRCMVYADRLGVFDIIKPEDVYFIGFTIYNGTFEKINDKYIPNTIARVGDAPVVTSPSGKKYKLTVDDSGTVSAVEVTE